MNNSISAGIIGGAGYAAGELIRLILQHPFVQLQYVYSNSHAGQSIESVHEDLFHAENMVFASTWHCNVDILFLCLEHGKSTQFISENQIPKTMLIVDLSQDFRVGNENWVYGLPESNKDTIAECINNKKNIANPGCFATALLLGVLPLAHTMELPKEIHASGITGSTGAGSGYSKTSHFSWRSGNAQPYKALQHQHCIEVNGLLHSIDANWKNAFYFVPYRGSYTRGITAAMYLKFDGSKHDAETLYQNYYDKHPFVHVVKNTPHTKMTVNTNYCCVHLDKCDSMLIVSTALDNLMKGAAGQAVQNMNIAFGFDETTGLICKASYY